MAIVQQSIDISVSPERVWHVITGDETYRQWTAVFHPGSYVKTTWEEGADAHFLTPEGMGLASTIEVCRPHEAITFRHRCAIVDGKEDPDGEESKSWHGLTESYRLASIDSGTRLSIEMETTDDYKVFMTDTWAKALAKLKELAESE